MRLFIGIDPGLTGAVALIGEGYQEVYDTPTLMNGKRYDYDVAAMAKILASIGDGNGPSLQDYLVVIERAGAMPKQGVSSTFTFGKGFGIWLGIIAAFGLPHEVISPQRWKKAMVPGSGDKDAGRLVAIRLFPKAELHLKKHHGRADALLLAEYAKRTNGIR